MLPLPPSPPPPPPFTQPPPPPQNQATPYPKKQMFSSKQVENQHLLPLDLPCGNKIKPRGYPKLKRPRRTNPIVWCTAVFCLIFSILLIFFGIATLIIFLDVKPRRPVIDTPSASLSVVYVNSPELFFNGDLAFVANFSNPNRKLDLRFESLDIELYFLDSLIAAQALQPFTQRRGETRSVSVHMISSMVHLPPHLVLELQKQVQNNRVIYHIKGTFRVRINLGLVHFSYWLHAKCQLDLSSPPTGILLARSCITKR